MAGIIYNLSLQGLLNEKTSTFFPTCLKGFFTFYLKISNMRLGGVHPNVFPPSFNVPTHHHVVGQ
jgi:hypothetical protein